jgi:alpha-glucosidase (family GH31 glycosyl hydrolase)
VIENSHLLPEESTPEPGTEHRIRNPGRLATASTLELLYTVQPFGFAVIRKSNGAILFDTRPEGSSQGRAAAAAANEVPPPPGSTITCLPSSFKRIVFKDQYIEVATALPSSSAIYGLGEGTRPDGMRLRPGRNYTLWATDVGSWNIDIALYSAYPFYMDVRSGGFAHGVLLLNSNGMDVEHTYQGLVYRVIGGVLDFYFFGGPSPAAVMDQFTYLVGRPAAMPYWSLGTQMMLYPLIVLLILLKPHSRSHLKPPPLHSSTCST